MNDNKTEPGGYCPLLSLNDPDSLSDCEGCRCAWWVPPASRYGQGRCAITYLAAIAEGVLRL